MATPTRWRSKAPSSSVITTERCLATRAPNGYGQVTFSLAFERGRQNSSNEATRLQKPYAVGLRQHEPFHGLGRARQIAELRHEVRVVQESDVEQ